MNLEIFQRLNHKINLLTICIGLFVSFIIPLIVFGMVGEMMLSGTGQITDTGYYLFLPSMALLGGFTATLLGSRTMKSALLNGGFLGLVMVIIMGFILGTLFLIFMNFIGALSTVFGTPTTSNNVTDNTQVLASFLKIVLQPFLIIWGGMIGGAGGFLIKYPFIKN